MPTGLEAEIIEEDDVNKVIQFFNKYERLFTINTAFKYDKNSKSWIPDSNKINLEWNLDTPENMLLLVDLLNNYSNVYKPSNDDEFMSKYSKLGLSIKTKEQFDNLFVKIKEFIDEHNLYLDNVSQSRLIRIMNNYNTKSMYDIGMDPANLIQAQSPVDSTTGPLKDVANQSVIGEQLKQRTPGNFYNKFQSITDNQVGKDDIAICAVGLKCFFGLTQYFNYVLNYSPDQQYRLLINNGGGYKIGGKTYRTLANIRPKDPSTITNDMVLEALSYANNDTDAALILSALLSLSTDNAKELALSKLNASTKLIGMYIYGISMGMEFQDIARILMSKSGSIFAKILDGDVFTQRNEYIRAVSGFKYFEQFPYYLINKYRSQLRILERKLNEKLGESKEKKELFSKKLNSFAKSNMELQKKIAILEDIRSTESSEEFNALIDEVESYVYNNDIVHKEGFLKDLMTLSEGADEMRRMGSIFSYNQGIKTDYEGFIRQVNLIEKAIYDITGEERDIIDLSRFANDKNYREKAIERYEEVKHSFNILDAVSTVPHFFGYLKSLAAALEEYKLSFKFRSIKKMTDDIVNTYGIKEDVTKGLQGCVGDFMRNQWMLSKEVNMYLPVMKSFDHKGNITENTSSPIIRLGTDWGNASFRLFMETKVIPDLINGIIQPNISFPGVSNNMFIKDLVNDLYTNTVSRNPSIIYTLPINMLPRTDQERAIFDQYKTEFNKLAQFNYRYHITKVKDDGSIVTTLSNPIPITDLFIYYAMIVNDWKLGEKSLVPILEDFQNTGIIKEFHDFEAILDKSNTDITQFVKTEYALPYVVQSDNPYTSFKSRIRYRNKETRKFQIMYHMDRSELEEVDIEDTSVIGEYRFNPSVDTNYFTRGEIEDRKVSIQRDFKVNGTDYNFHVIYNKDDDKVISLELRKTGNIDIINEGVQLDEMKYKKVDGIKVENVEYIERLLKNYIKNKENQCS